MSVTLADPWRARRRRGEERRGGRGRKKKPRLSAKELRNRVRREEQRGERDKIQQIKYDADMNEVIL